MLVSFCILWAVAIFLFVSNSSFVATQSRDGYWTVFSQLGRGAGTQTNEIREPVDRMPVGRIPDTVQSPAVAPNSESQPFTHIRDSNIGSPVGTYRLISIFGDLALLHGPNGLIAIGQDSDIPNVGRVRGLHKRNGRYWVLVTTNGFIERIPR